MKKIHYFNIDQKLLMSLINITNNKVFTSYDMTDKSVISNIEHTTDLTSYIDKYSSEELFRKLFIKPDAIAIRLFYFYNSGKEIKDKDLEEFNISVTLSVITDKHTGSIVEKLFIIAHQTGLLIYVFNHEFDQVYVGKFTFTNMLTAIPSFFCTECENHYYPVKGELIENLTIDERLEFNKALNEIIKNN